MKNNLIKLNIAFYASSKIEAKTEFLKILDAILEMPHISSMLGEYSIYGKKEIIDIL